MMVTEWCICVEAVTFANNNWGIKGATVLQLLESEGKPVTKHVWMIANIFIKMYCLT